MNALTKIDIPNDHLAHVMNVAIAEAIFGFERRLEANEFEWRGSKTDGTHSEWSRVLPPFATDLSEGVHVLKQVSRQLGLGFNIIYNPLADQCIVAILRPTPDGKSAAPTGQISGRPLPELVAAAICMITNLDLNLLHRELYPGHYMALNQ